MDKDIKNLYDNLVYADKAMKDAKRALQECMNSKLYEFLKSHKVFYRRGANSSFIACDINNFVVEEFVEKRGHITSPYVMQIPVQTVLL